MSYQLSSMKIEEEDWTNLYDSLLAFCRCSYKGCPENIYLYWISQELVMWSWCNLAASQRIPYCASLNSHCPVGLVSQQWDAVNWPFVLYDRHIHSGLSAPLQPRFGSLWLMAFSEAKIAVEREEICECNSHTVHKVSQRHLTADWLALQESDWTQMHSKVSSDWLPSYMKATRPVLKIFKMARYFPDRPRTLWKEI
jgi:hypothetical protein